MSLEVVIEEIGVSRATVLESELLEAEQKFLEADEAEDTARSLCTAARNRLTECQKAFDTYLNQLREDASGGKWSEDRRKFYPIK